MSPQPYEVQFETRFGQTAPVTLTTPASMNYTSTIVNDELHHSQGWWVGLNWRRRTMTTTADISASLPLTDTLAPQIGHVLDQGFVQQNERWVRHDTIRFNYRLLDDAPEFLWPGGVITIYFGASPEGRSFIGSLNQIVIDPGGSKPDGGT